MTRVRGFVLSAVLFTAACHHSDAFEIAGQGTNQPFIPGSPVRLTYNVLPDTEAAWLPGRDVFLYTAFRADDDSVGCLEILPGTGGQATRSICEPRPAGDDSLVAYESGAVSPGGILAYLRVAKGPPHDLWTEQVLTVRPLDGSAPPRAITPLPAVGLIPPHTSASRIAWVDDHRFVYRADQYLAKFRCITCRPPYDTSTGLFVNLVDIATTPPTITTVPGTDSVVGLAVQDSDAILVTLTTSPGVHRIVLSTGASSVFWNAGTGDIQVAGNRLILVDGGGIRMVDVPSSTTTVIDTLPSWLYPALSSNGKRLVVSRGSDLWGFDLP